MGSGCSSPLRRFGGKRGNPSSTHRDSDPYGMNVADNQIDSKKSTIKTSHFTHQNIDQQPPKTTTTNLTIDQEYTVQSDINDDHPSTGSCNADCKVDQDSQAMKQTNSNIAPLSTTMAPHYHSSTGNGVATLSARMKGLNGTYVPHDRHLLVSPALSPAPSSTCYSPPPATSALGHIASLDLNELVDAFEILTFGLPNDKIQVAMKQQSELQQYYTQHLVQDQNDLINSISVIFISADNLGTCQDDKEETNKTPNSNIESNNLSKQIEANLKTFCDEHIYNLRFLNISSGHLKKHFHINNIVDVTQQIVEQEYQQNSQRVVIIVLANMSNTNSTDSDKRQLPSKIDSHTMSKLNNSKSFNGDDMIKNLFKKWYEKIGNKFHLKPIYTNNPAILSESIPDRQQAWDSWLKDSSIMIKAITDAVATSDESMEDICSKGHFDLMIDYLLREPGLQKRTLLIRNQIVNGNTPGFNNNASAANLNELARLLPDPNKMSLKRPMNQDEFVKNTGTWVQENFNKFFDNIQENQISHGKYIPPFIEKNLFQELTLQRSHLQYYLDNVAEILIAKSHNFYLSQILPILDTIATEANNNPTNNGVLQQSKIEPTNSSSHLVFISGPKGCGKTTLFSQMIKFAAKDFHDRAHIIYRYCGISLDSLSSNRILRSICEQFCQIQGENITAASYVYSNREAITCALNKIFKVQPTIVFLDGLDLFNLSQDICSWLCELDSSSNVKVIISVETDSRFYRKALDTYVDASYITLDNPNLNEWTQVLSSCIKNRHLSSTSIMEEIRRMSNSDQADLKNKPNYHDMAEILNLTHCRKLNNEFNYQELTFTNDVPPNQTEIFEKVLNTLTYLITPYQLGSLIIAIHSSRNGLFENDLINIMTMISQSSKAYADTEHKFSFSLWSYIKRHMRPWLSTLICDRFLKVRIQNDFAQFAIQYYTSKQRFPYILDETRDVLFDYFNRSNAARSSSKFSILKPLDTSSDRPELKGNTKHMTNLQLATQASEIANYLVTTNKSKAIEHLVNKIQFFSQFLNGSIPEEFIEDCERLKDIEGRKSSSNDDLQTLVSYIKQSIYPLRYDGHQIYSQIYCRAYDLIKSGKSTRSKKINEILNVASNPLVTSLLPISEQSVNSFIKTRIGLQSNDKNAAIAPSGAAVELLNYTIGAGPPSSGPAGQRVAQAKQKVFTIKDDHRHVVVIYPEKGLLSVWDIYDEVAVRTISNLDHPRDLRMIDKQRAVILCNRELRVYDLDSGAMLAKLKGVMNQKMPFFEVFGDQYAIALARNRMYVNLLNLKTGELETTFKVGEDRFLNSLLVSADGGICVCGDETQKPFPLLVWNLNERRLMYDLRLDRHEFLTKFSAISDDGQIVVSACRQIGATDNNTSASSPGQEGHLHQKTTPNFIVIYDLSSGTLFKKWKPGLDTCAVAIAYLPNKSGKLVINAIADSTILVWDLVTGSRK